MERKYQIKSPCKQYQLESKGDGINYNCKACNKNVKDLCFIELPKLFSGMQSEENTCVKILPSQINQLNHLLTKSKRAVLLASALAVMTTSCTNKLIQDFGEEYGKVNLSKASKASNSLAKNNVKGKLVDSFTNEPIQFATIRIPGYELEAMTDLEGNFNFEIPSEVNKTSKVHFEYIGYYGIEIEVDKIMGKEIIVSLGGAVIGYIELIK